MHTDCIRQHFPEHSHVLSLTCRYDELAVFLKSGDIMELKIEHLGAQRQVVDQDK